MSEAEKISLLEEAMDLEPGTLKPEDVLADFDEWDSIAALSLIAVFDSNLGKTLSGDDIKKFVTVKDVIDFMEA